MEDGKTYGLIWEKNDLNDYNFLIQPTNGEINLAKYSNCIEKELYHLKVGAEWYLRDSEGNITTFDKSIVRKATSNFGTRDFHANWVGDISKIDVGSDNNIYLKVNEKKTLSPNVLPSNLTDYALKWKSKDSSIVSVNNNGVITAKKMVRLQLQLLMIWVKNQLNIKYL